VEELKGAASLSKAGSIITAQALSEDVEQTVAAKSCEMAGNQHPAMKGEIEGTLPLVRVR
jgi:hypothetical protein